MQAAMDGSSRILLAIAALMLVCLLRKASAQGDTGPVLVVTSPDNLNIFRGGSIDFYCYCTRSALPPVSSVRWLRDGMEVDSWSSCVTFVIRLSNVDYEDDGEYTCQVELENGTVIVPGGLPLNVVDPNRIQAEPQQYGLLHSNTSLSCWTNFTDVDPSLISFIWERNCTVVSEQITDASLAHEGQYVCRVYLGHLGGLEMKKNVTFYVVVPPTIISQPPAIHEIRGNPSVSLTVEFQSRFRENTTVAWYRDSSRLAEGRVQTEYTSRLDGRTAVSFDPISRSDSGVYRVVIENSDLIIPQLQRTVETSFNVSVIVPPSIPSNLRVLDITSSRARITWFLTNQHADEEADTMILTLDYLDGTLAEQHSLPGNAMQQTVTTFPGMEYRLTLTTSNQDGTRTAGPVSFQTPAGAPSSPLLEVTRLGNTTFNLSIHLDYTGGGAITHLLVSFWDNRTSAWISVGRIPANPSPESSLVWSGVVSRDEFVGMTVQFKVAVVNSRLYQSTAAVVQEPLVLSRAPTLSLLSSTSFSVTVEVQLSPDGTPPIVGIVFNFTSPPGLPQRRLAGPFAPGDTISETLSGLERSTEYRVTASAFNLAGFGPSSDEITFTTDIVIWIIVLIAVAAIIVIVTIPVVGMVTYHSCKVHRRKKEYYINPVTSANEKQLDPTHEMVTRQSNPLLSQLSQTSLTPRSPTTSPPAPTPPMPTDSPANFKFKFETGSSNGSTNNDTDESEANCPRYTYAVSPSPGDSLHSLQTKTTSLHSTRESLIYPPASSNATDV